MGAVIDMFDKQVATEKDLQPVMHPAPQTAPRPPIPNITQHHLDLIALRMMIRSIGASLYTLSDGVIYLLVDKDAVTDPLDYCFMSHFLQKDFEDEGLYPYEVRAHKVAPLGEMPAEMTDRLQRYGKPIEPARWVTENGVRRLILNGRSFIAGSRRPQS